MKKSRLLIVLALVIILAISLVACGPNGLFDKGNASIVIDSELMKDNTKLFSFLNDIMHENRNFTAYGYPEGSDNIVELNFTKDAVSSEKAVVLQRTDTGFIRYQKTNTGKWVKENVNGDFDSAVKPVIYNLGMVFDVNNCKNVKYDEKTNSFTADITLEDNPINAHYYLENKGASVVVELNPAQIYSKLVFTAFGTTKIEIPKDAFDVANPDTPNPENPNPDDNTKPEVNPNPGGGDKEEVVNQELDYPTADVLGDKIVPVDNNMMQDSKAMFLNAVANYYKTNYTSVYQDGVLETTLMGQKVKQKVQSLRIRENGESFMYNNSYSAQGMIDIKIMEKYYVNKDGRVSLTCANPKSILVDAYNRTMACKDWSHTQIFADLDSYLIANPNDPSRLNMFNLNGDTILSTTNVKKFADHNGKTYYKFKVSVDGNKAFKEYIPVIEYMLYRAGKINGNVNPNKAQTLTFDVEIWDNGVFRQYDMVEGYGVDLKIGSNFSGDVELLSNVKFGYNRVDFPLTNYIKDGKFVL